MQDRFTPWFCAIEHAEVIVRAYANTGHYSVARYGEALGMTPAMCDLIECEVEILLEELAEERRLLFEHSAELAELLETGGVTCRGCKVHRAISEFPKRGRWGFRSVSACAHCGSREARLAAAPRDEYERLDIAVRDGWMCALCNLPIDPMLSDPYDPGYLNIDHIIPVTAPNFPGDILSNVQASHRLCNIRKGGFKG